MAFILAMTETETLQADVCTVEENEKSKEMKGLSDFLFIYSRRTLTKSKTNNSQQGGSGRNGIQCVFQVGDNVFHVLQAHGEADEVFGDLRFLPLLVRQVNVRDQSCQDDMSVRIWSLKDQQ